jgi:hypothetical protein
VSTQLDSREAGPGVIRGVAVLTTFVLAAVMLMSRVDTGEDAEVRRLGRVEVTARLLGRPDEFPAPGAYRYTYVLPYEVLRVHRVAPQLAPLLKPGARIFVGHYQPWLPRSAIGDAGWGTEALGGRLTEFVTGAAHRLALDYALEDLAPAGVLDDQFPPGTNRYFAVWANPTTL